MLWLRILKHTPHLVRLSSSRAFTPSYTHLKQFESTRYLDLDHRTRVDVVYLNANHPMEDRFAVGVSKNLASLFFSVIDGHCGDECTQYLQQNMLAHISSHLNARVNSEDDFEVVLDMDIVEQMRKLGGDTKEPPEIMYGHGMAPEMVVAGLRESLVSLDNKIIQQSGIGDAGACALTVVMHDRHIFVANTGDCRVVLGQELVSRSADNWITTPLSADQNSSNLDEVNRIYAAHPGEKLEDLISSSGRLCGNLIPFRAFGDVCLKCSPRLIKPYLTDPYLTAEPVVSRMSLHPNTIIYGDVWDTYLPRFFVLATDGLWDKMSNERAVKIVADTLRTNQSTNRRQSTNTVNAATELLWDALGGDDSKVQEMLKKGRYHRDDITIMVVHLN